MFEATRRVGWLLFWRRYIVFFEFGEFVKSLFIYINKEEIFMAHIDLGISLGLIQLGLYFYDKYKENKQKQ